MLYSTLVSKVFLTLRAALVLGLAMAATAASAQATQVGDFALLDATGKFHQMSWYGDHKAIVVVAHGNSAVVVKDQVAVLKALQTNHTADSAEDSVAFFLLNAELADNRMSIAADSARVGYTLPILVDESQLAAETLGITRVGEALVIDTNTMTVTYRGAIAGLAEALDSADLGASAQPQASVGALISFNSRDTQLQNAVSYTKDIAPILVDNCVSCHHEGAIGSWSMNSHAMVRGFSPMIREVLLTKRMPPGQIDMHVGKPIAGVAGLTAKEQQLLVHWIDAGSPFDGDASADPLAALVFNDPKYALGEPDMIVKVPSQSVPATGIVDYRFVPVELNLDKDVWVRAMEFIPGDTKALHHVITYLSSPADKTARGRENGSARGDSVGGFAPGRGPEEFRDNSGRLITKGSNLLLQMHYTTYGKETVDETEIGIYLHDKPPAYVMAGGVAGQRRFFVPPGAKEHKLEGVQEIEKDAWLYSLNPHMHYRGKYMNYTAEYPDGTSEMLLSVPRYDFNWQFNYELEEPLFLPAGSKLVARGAMDNSSRNRNNPDPTKPVHFGLQTMHEMFFGFTTLRYEGETPGALGSSSAAGGGN